MASAIMPSMELVVRPARPEDPADELLYLSAKPYYDAYAGDAARARRLLRLRLRPRRGTPRAGRSATSPSPTASSSACWRPSPSGEGDRLARRFVALTFPRLPAWRWPGPGAPPGRVGHGGPAAARRRAVRRRAGHRAGGAAAQGVARALLDEAERLATRERATGVALDTGLGNRAARALYEGAGFERREVRHAADDRIARAIGGPGFVSYFRRLPAG